jgi:hypothetical protein
VRWFRAVGAAAVVTLALLPGGVAGAAVFSPAAGGTTIGPLQINAIGHPRLCWQATGNGAPIVLAACDSALPTQQWSLTPNGVMMNGFGYCLEARSGQPRGVPLDIDFAGQCGGIDGQVWRYNGSTGQLSSSGICAGLGGPVSPGTEIVRRACPPAVAQRRWSLGYSLVTLARGRGSGLAGGTFGASVTVSNAASAQIAYGAVVRFGLPRPLALVGLHGASGWTCDVRTVSCTGTLAAGTSAQVGLAGRLPDGARPGGSYVVSARASVAGTSQLRGLTRATAEVTVAVHAAAPGSGAAGPGGLPAAALPLVALIAGLLLLGGGLLAALAWRGRRAPI